MTSIAGSASALEYYPVRYGSSRVLFRGPRRQLDGPYIAFLGGTETYGRFIETPFPTLVEREMSLACVNFGVANAGLDLYLNDPAIMEIAERADAKVIQIMGAQNLSNRFYSVHPRRNDRFLRASDRLEALYPEVDFTEFHFNRHMLNSLVEISQDRFGILTEELRAAWVARMKHLLSLLKGRVVLLWFSDHQIPEETENVHYSSAMFVTREMLEILRPRVSAVVEVVASKQATTNHMQGMVYNEFDACAAEELLGPKAHSEAEKALSPVLQSLLND